MTRHMLNHNGAGFLPSNSGDLPIICRDCAGDAGYGGVMFREGAMGEVMGLGTRQPDGGKVVKLRKQLEMKQEELAERARISVRHLREIERTSKPVAGTTITAIATVPQTRSLFPSRTNRSRTKMTTPG